MFTHNLMTLIFAPLLVAYVGFIWFRERDRKALGLAAVALFLAFGLAALYLLPGFVESGWARLGVVGPQATDYDSRLITVADFFSPFLIYRYFPEQGTQLQHPISWLQFGLVCLSLTVPLRLRHASWAQARRHVVFFLCAALVSVFMLFVYSRPLWEYVPLLSYLQYPYRFLTLTSFTSAFAIGSLPLLLVDGSAPNGEVLSAAGGRSLWGLAMTAIVVAALMITSLPGLPIEPQYLPEHEEPLMEETVSFATMAEYDYLTGLWARLYPSAWLMEYLPTWVQTEPGELFLPVDKPPSEVRPLTAEEIPTMSILRHGPLSMELEVSTAQTRTISFHSFYVPNWGIYLDGQKQTTYPLGKMGLLAVDVSPGQHHMVVRFENTPVEQIATIISLVSLTLVLAILVVTRRRRALMAALMVCLILGLATVWHVRSSSSIQHPAPVGANLGHQLKLLGYHVERSAYRPGEEIDVTLY